MLHLRLFYTIAYSCIHDFWKMQPNAFGQIGHFTKCDKINKLKVWCIRSISSIVCFARVIFQLNAADSRITTKCCDCIAYRRGGRLFGKYSDKHIRSEYSCYHSKEKVWADVLNTHNTTIWLTKKFLRRFEKKVCKFLKSKYASSLSQFYMALVVFCMKFFTLNVSKKLSIHFLSTFYIFKTFSGTRAIQRTLNRVFAMRQTQANVDKSVKNVKFCSYVAYLIAYGAIW